MVREVNLKKSYVNFFIKNKHVYFKESCLIPKKSTKLLFTNSGMNQFTNYLSNKKNSFFKKIISLQKCVRLGGKHNDINTVGFDQTHHTLFNMLGN
jgi:alanyl-tRNA synthetase